MTTFMRNRPRFLRAIQGAASGRAPEAMNPPSTGTCSISKPSSTALLRRHGGLLPADRLPKLLREVVFEFAEIFGEWQLGDITGMLEWHLEVDDFLATSSQHDDAITQQQCLA